MKIIVSPEDLKSTYHFSKFCAQKAVERASIWLPLHPSATLSAIAADIMTDGYIDSRQIGKSRYFGYIGYFSKSEQELIEFNRRMRQLFGVRGKIREWGVREYGTSKGCIITNAVLARILNLCGIPAGNKTQTAYQIPSWILDGSQEIKTAFLRRAFSCEGSISCRKNQRGWRVRYSMCKVAALAENLDEFLRSMICMLNEFGIVPSGPFKNESYIRKKDNAAMLGKGIAISKPKSIALFKKKIGFDIPYKQEKLEQAVAEFGG